MALRTPRLNYVEITSTSIKVFLLETQEGYDNFNSQLSNSEGNIASQTTNNTNLNPIIFSNLQPNSPYDIIITSIFSGVTGNLHLPYLKTSPDSPLLQTPTINGNFVDLSWTLQNSNEVFYDILVNNEKINQMEINNTTYQLPLDNQSMTIKIRAYNKYLTTNYSIGNGQVFPDGDYLINYSDFSNSFTNNGTQNISDSVLYNLQLNSLVIQLPNIQNNYNITLLKDQQIINSTLNFTGNQYTFENLDYNSTYQLMVIENSLQPLSFFYSSMNNQNSVPILTYPNSPQNFTKNYDQTGLSFSWDFQPNISYKIKKSTDSQYTDIGAINNYTWNNQLEDNTEVLFQLIAYNLSGTSDPTTISFLTLPNSPVSYSIQTISETSKKITWIPPTNNSGLSYKILDFNFQIIATTQNTEYTFSDLTPSFYYNYYVSSQNQTGTSTQPLQTGFGVDFNSITNFKYTVGEYSNNKIDINLSWEFIDNPSKHLFLFYELNFNGQIITNITQTNYQIKINTNTENIISIKAIYSSIVIVKPLDILPINLYAPPPPNLKDFTFSKLALNNYSLSNSQLTLKLIPPNNNLQYFFSYNNIEYQELNNQTTIVFSNINKNSNFSFYIKSSQINGLYSFPSIINFNINNNLETSNQLLFLLDKIEYSYQLPVNQQYFYTLDTNNFISLEKNSGIIRENTNANYITFISSNLNNNYNIFISNKLIYVPNKININNISNNKNILDLTKLEKGFTYLIEYYTDLNFISIFIETNEDYVSLPNRNIYFVRISKILKLNNRDNLTSASSDIKILFNLQKPNVNLIKNVSIYSFLVSNYSINISTLVQKNEIELVSENMNLINTQSGNLINYTDLSFFNQNKFYIRKKITEKNIVYYSENSNLISFITDIAIPEITNINLISGNNVNIQINIGTNVNPLYKVEIITENLTGQQINRTILINNNSGIVSGNFILPNNQVYNWFEVITYGLIDNIEYKSNRSRKFNKNIVTTSQPPQLKVSSFLENIIKLQIEKPINIINSNFTYEFILNSKTTAVTIPNSENLIDIDVTSFGLSMKDNFDLEISIWNTTQPTLKNNYLFSFKATQYEKTEIPPVNIIKPIEPVFNSDVKLVPPPGLQIHTTSTEEFSKETGLTLNDLTNNTNETNLSIKIIQDQKNLNLKSNELLVFKAQPEGALFSDYIKISFIVQNNTSPLYKVYKISNNIASEIPFYSTGIKPDAYFIKPSSTLIEVYTKSFSKFLAPFTAPQPEPEPEPETTYLPCFTENTQILTPTGYKLITELKEKDLVLTDDNRQVPIVKIKQFTTTNHKDFPYIIRKFSITKNYPPTTFTISGGHSIKYNDKWIIPKLFGCKQDLSKKSILYFHIKLPNYSTDNLVINNGTIAESYGIDYYTKYQKIGSSKFYHRFCSKKSNISLSK